MIANLWLMINIKYILKRKKIIKNTINVNTKISNELMVPYSIVKEYFIKKNKYYKNVNQ